MKRVVAAVAGALAFAAIAVAAGAQVPKLPPPPAGPQVGQSAPAFRLPGLRGGPIALARFRGQVVYLDFWATWCEPCRKEIPKLAALQRQFGGRGFTVLGVALDDGGAAVVKPAARELGINYPVALGTIPVAAAYGGMEGLPTAFLLGRDGKVLQIYYGVQPQAALRRAIRDALRGGRAVGAVGQVGARRPRNGAPRRAGAPGWS